MIDLNKLYFELYQKCNISTNKKEVFFVCKENVFYKSPQKGGSVRLPILSDWDKGSIIKWLPILKSFFYLDSRTWRDKTMDAKLMYAHNSSVKSIAILYKSIEIQ